MTIFVSYTRADEPAVRALRDDLDRMGHQVWLDHEIHGGELWWREIIRTIQAARVFVFALSQASWKSVPCHAEFDYAQQLDLPVLPVQVGPLDNLRIPIMERQLVDYRERDADAIVALAGALTELTARPRVLPNPLPTPPKVPFEYLYRIAELLGPQPIAPERQEIIIGQLRRHLRTERDEIARADILKLLREFRERGEITNLNSREIDEILANVEPAEGLPEGVTWLSAADHWRRNPVVIGPPKDPEDDAAERVEQDAGEPPERIEPVEAGESAGTGGAPAWLRGAVEAQRAAPVTKEAPSTTPWWQGDKPRPPEPPASAPPAAPTPAPEAASAPTSPWPTASTPTPAPGPGAVAGSAEEGGAGSEAAVADAGSPLAFVSAVLGAPGIPFLMLTGTGRHPIAATVALSVLTGLVLGVLAVRRQVPRARAALVIASVGLLGVVVYLVVPHAS
ncbi:toll/interleukin-1 receptor domain-containing protein [Actinosynnema sp. NPDC004786]